jgi:hypothetical protein
MWVYDGDDGFHGGEIVMAASVKSCGFVVVRAKLGATQIQDVLADRGVNVNDRDAEYSCSTADGTTTPAVVAAILRKLTVAVSAGASRVDILVDGNTIVG